MELTGAALRQSLQPVVTGGRRRRPPPSRVACVRVGFAEEGHLRYYEAGAWRKAAGARDLARIRAVGLVAGDVDREKEATDLLITQELNQMKEYDMKKVRKEEKAAMKALKKQQKEARRTAALMASCEDGSSSESSESDCEDEQVMKIGKGAVMISTSASEVGAATGVSTVYATECDKAAMKAMKKMEKEQKKAAKKAMKKMKNEAKKMSVAIMDEDSSSCSSESSESECEGEVVQMSRCATVVAPQQPAPSTVFPIIVPQLPESVPPEPLQEPRVSSESPSAPAMQCTTSVAVVEKPVTNRIEVCMGGKCKKAGALALLQEFEKVVGTGGAAVGCKCLGKCGLGPNVRLRSQGSAAEGSAKKNPLCIGVGLEDVSTIVTGLFGDGDLGVTTA